MKPGHRRVIRHYFSDWARWLALVTFGFALAMTCVVIFADAASIIWLTAGLFVVLYLTTFHSFILFLRVAGDVRKRAVSKALVDIATLDKDARYSFASSRGPDKPKYRLTCRNGACYLLCAEKTGAVFHGFSPDPEFPIEIEYLENSGLVLSMRLPSDRPTRSSAIKQGENKQRFRQLFGIYFN